MKRIQELELKRISKAFPGVQANQDIDLKIRSGEIVALLGENGAGKSTLMNILSGIILPDSGQIFINGSPVRIRNPKDAIHLGIGMVHQHFMLIQAMSVAENIALGLKHLNFLFPLKRIKGQLVDFARQYGFDISPRAKIWQLSIGQQQRVEILRVLMQGADLLILDEPTSVLTPLEIEDLFGILRKMKAEGHGVLFISHKLDEIKAISDRVIVMRKGRIVAEGITAELSNEDLAKCMVGKDLDLSLPEKIHSAGEVLLEAHNVYIRNSYGAYAVSQLNFQLHRHEVLGIAGVSGNGQKELAEGLTGLLPIAKGEIRLKGENITNFAPKQLLCRGMAHIPEERLSFGVVPSMMIFENTALKEYDRKTLSPKKWLDFARMKTMAQKIIQIFQVSASSVMVTTKTLSGGNIQKLILGREMCRNPEIIVAAHPTYGLDVSATQDIRRELLKKREEGSAILLISEDLEELLAMSDRIAVMYKGQFMGIVDRKEADATQLGLMMAGIKSPGAES